MRNNALGDGKETCLLCGSKFGTLKVISKRCDICDKVYYIYRHGTKIGFERFCYKSKVGQIWTTIFDTEVQRSFDFTFDRDLACVKAITHLT